MWICSPEFVGVKYELLRRDFNKVTLEFPEDLLNVHWFARKKFDSKLGITKIKISADDQFKLYCNGQFVGLGPAQAYAFRYPYLEFDLKPYLTEGENVIAAHIYYHGYITRAFQSADKRQGLWAELCDENGECIISTDTTWKSQRNYAWTTKDFFGYKTQFIERIDASLIPDGWTNTGFDDSQWDNATEELYDDHKLIPQDTSPLTVYFQKPVYTERRGNVIFCDMGAEITGSVTLKAAAKGKESILIRCGEELAEDGTVRYLMRCNCNYQNEWKLSGRETDTVEFFDYMAFRYFEVEAPDGIIDEDSVGVTVRHYPMDESACELKGDEDAEKIFAICKQAVKCNLQDGFFDCPSREKGQYLGDATVIAHAHLLITGDPLPYKRLLKEFASSSYVCPGLLAVVPGSLRQEIADYSCQFPQQILTYYKLTGDIDLVRELMPVVDGLEDYFDRYKNEDGLVDCVNKKWNLVDWPAVLRDGYDFDLSEPVAKGTHNVMNAFYYGLKRDADEIRKLLGIPQRGEAERVRNAFIKAFRLPNGLFSDSPDTEHTALHSNALPLFYGITPTEDIPKAVELIRRKGLSCGVYFSYFVLLALARVGEYELMNELLFSDELHSWKNMIKEGATTCFEAWGKDEKKNTSLCHAWASSPIIMLIEEVVGLKTQLPGFEKYSVEPHLPKNIEKLSLTIKTIKGGNLAIECTKSGAKVTEM